MISVLLPTRERSELARQSIESLGEGLEVLLYVDEDDPQIEDYDRLLDAKVIKGKRVGYHGMHDMVNQLAKQATGDWLLLWNDDALMHTQDWQWHIPIAGKPEVLNIFNSNDQVNLFPLISRSMYEAMGHYSLSAHCDSWVQDIANEIGIHTYIPDINVEHLRDRLNDETKQHSQGAYAQTSPLHVSPQMVSAMESDIKKIQEHLL
jgi:hypothetical protein